jgi:hypothetical protein
VESHYKQRRFEAFEAAYEARGGHRKGRGGRGGSRGWGFFFIVEVVVSTHGSGVPRRHVGSDEHDDRTGGTRGATDGRHARRLNPRGEGGPEEEDDSGGRQRRGC